MDNNVEPRSSEQFGSISDTIAILRRTESEFNLIPTKERDRNPCSILISAKEQDRFSGSGDERGGGRLT